MAYGVSPEDEAAALAALNLRYKPRIEDPVAPAPVAFDAPIPEGAAIAMPARSRAPADPQDAYVGGGGLPTGPAPNQPVVISRGPLPPEPAHGRDDQPPEQVPARRTPAVPQGPQAINLFERRSSSSANPYHQMTSDWIGSSAQAQAAFDAASRAKLETDNVVAEEMATEAAVQRYQGEEALLQAQRLEQTRAQQIDEEMETSQQYVSEMRNAAKQLQTAAEIDPRRYWASRSGGQKFLAGIGVLLGVAGGGGSMAGRNTGVETIKDAIREDIEVQKANFGQKQAGFGAIADATNTQSNLFTQLRAKLGDDRAAELALEGARLEQASRTIDSMLAKGASAQARANGELAKSQLDQAAADVRLQLEQRAKANPRRIASSGYTHQGPVADALRGVELQKIKAEGKAYEAGAVTGATAAAKEPYEVAKDERQVGLEGAKARGAVDAKTAEKEGERINKIKDTTAKWGHVERMIDEFLQANPDDIAGHGLWMTGTRGERISTDSFKTLLPEMVTTAVTGAVASPEQSAKSQKLVEGDWNDITDDDLRNRLRALKELASSQRRYLQNELGADKPGVQQTSQFSTFRPE